MEGKAMEAHVNFNKEIGYYVSAYFQMPKDRNKKWHILRSFIEQGDAIRFARVMETRTDDFKFFAGSYNPQYVCYQLDIKEANGNAVLKMQKRNNNI